MPENNPFSMPADEKPAANLSAREKLFADMGLSPQGKPESPDAFADEDSAFLEADFALEPIEVKDADFISLSEAKPADLVADEDLVVDAIFSSTETEKQSAQFSLPEEPTLDFEEPAVVTVSEPGPTTQTEPALEIPASQSRETTSAILKSLDQAGLDNVAAAYIDLQKKLTANQALISAEREAIAELRNHMRQLNASSDDLADNSAGLDQSRKLIQADSCQNLIHSITQVNEIIQQDSQRAAQLMKPIKAGVEVLELRVKHVGAIENLLKHMQAGLALQNQLAGADALMHDLAKHLGLSLN